MFTIISPAKELENAQEQWLLHVLAARPHHALSFITVRRWFLAISSIWELQRRLGNRRVHVMLLCKRHVSCTALWI